MTLPVSNDDRTAPVRIQRKRTKGWRMPPDTVYVGRPSRFANPYRIGEMTPKQAVEKFRKLIFYIMSDLPGDRPKPWLQQKHTPLYWCTKAGSVNVHPSVPLAPLRGKNLACWCPLDQPCHADVLLEIAND